MPKGRSSDRIHYQKHTGMHCAGPAMVAFQCVVSVLIRFKSIHCTRIIKADSQSQRGFTAGEERIDFPQVFVHQHHSVRLNNIYFSCGLSGTQGVMVGVGVSEVGL